MKRYLLFSGEFYYPSCGWVDFVCDFDSAEDAVKHSDRSEWRHVVDTETMEIVCWFSRDEMPWVDPH